VRNHAVAPVARALGWRVARRCNAPARCPLALQVGLLTRCVPSHGSLGPKVTVKKWEGSKHGAATHTEQASMG